MTLQELFQELKSIGYPVAYGSFAKPTPPPYLIYQFAYSNDFIADGMNYLEISNFQVELYTDYKDPATEKKVQDKLKELRLPYSKIETWLDSENLRQVIYEVQIIGG